MTATQRIRQIVAAPFVVGGIFALLLGAIIVGGREYAGEVVGRL